ncbi:MAG: hypothetical protein DRP57_10975 [Spirochaetes bacterium]|nr:MAG: hypothetical protein DRP57_10975 [Spirochaetota bacterium]
MLNEVKPFKTLTYNPEIVGNIGYCLAQPYDVISEELLDQYYKQCPYNIVRLTLNRENDSDTEKDNRYTRALKIFESWKNKQVLTESGMPLFWAYEQEFALYDEWAVSEGKAKKIKKKLNGFIGLVKLRDYSERAILPHEKVLEKPLEDRIKLIETTKMQFEYIWGIYNDRESRVDAILEKSRKDKPFINYYEDLNGVTHRLWKIEDRDLINSISRVVDNSKIYIADGHHRYQAMLEIRNRMRKKYPNAGPDAPWEYIIMYLVNFNNEGLTILPTHRVLHDLDIKRIKDLNIKIEEFFHVKSYPFHNGEEEKARLRWLHDLKGKEQGEHKFGAYIKKIRRYYLLTLKDSEAYKELIDLPYSSVWKLLDVNIINTLILRNIVGLTEAELSAQTYISYIKDIKDAIASVNSGENQVALILNASTLNDIVTLAENGEKMPRKATYFYPKPLSGLVFYKIV